MYSPELHNFICTKCGECCRNLGDDAIVVLFPDDYPKMQKGLNLAEDEFKQKYTEPSDYLSENDLEIRKLRSSDGKCIFLTEQNLCSVYDFQPIQCKLGPNNFMAKHMTHYPCMSDQADSPLDTEENDIKLFARFFNQIEKGGEKRCRVDRHLK